MTKTQALKFYDSASALARALKVSRQAVHQWLKIPPAQQIKLERLTAGELQADTDCWEKLLQPNVRKAPVHAPRSRSRKTRRSHPVGG
jgi:DNA-binding transcriptional regulator YdaS (Cro superfamily)